MADRLFANWRGWHLRRTRRERHNSRLYAGHYLMGYEHIGVAMKALGRYPARVHVHHVNEDFHDNRPRNLIICQDAAYHALLHRKTAQLRRGLVIVGVSAPIAGPFGSVTVLRRRPCWEPNPKYVALNGSLIPHDDNAAPCQKDMLVKAS